MKRTSNHLKWWITSAGKTSALNTLQDMFDSLWVIPRVIDP